MSTDLTTLSMSSLADFYAVPRDQWVRSNMVISLDGHFVDAAQSSDKLSSEFDLTVLLLLRALSDVVLVGGRTARQENYKPKPCRPQFVDVARPLTRVAVLTQSLELDVKSDLFHGQSKPILLTTSAACKKVPASHLEELANVADIASTSEITGSWVVSTLHNLGLDRIVSEGGPYVQNLLRQDNSLNELNVTIAPIILGKNEFGSAFGVTSQDLNISAVGRAGDHLFVRYVS